MKERFSNPYLPRPCYARPMGTESLRLFSEPSLFGWTNRLASWNGKPGMHILRRNECMRNKIELGTYCLYQCA